MDELYGISVRGYVNELEEWRHRNPQLSLNQKFTVHGRTPLHIAAMCGHVKFAEKLCSFDSRLTTEVDSHRLTPLHLAAARPSLSMVNQLLEANRDVCMEKDKDGRTPLYLAVMQDRYKTMRELILKKPEAYHIRYDQNQTILHLCVKHDSLISLKLLMAKDLPHGDALSVGLNAISIDSKDDDGNTILHLAAKSKQAECIKFLVEDKNTRIDINALNNDNVKAFDMLTQQERDSLEIGCFLSEKEGEIHQEWLKERVSALMVVATLIAGIAFQAAINPPGGVFQEDSYVDARDKPVIFTYYLGSLAKSSKSSHFKKYLSGFNPLQPSNITQSKNSTKLTKTATFVSKLLGTLNNASYGHDNPYVVSKSPGIVLEHKKWNPIISEHKSNTNFTPYLIRYAGTPILAYAHPNIYSIYIVCNAVAFLMSLSIIMLVITGPMYKDSIHHPVKVLVCTLFFALTLLIGSYIAVFISMTPPFYDNKLTLAWSSIGGSAILWFSMFGYLMIRRKWNYWNQKIRLHIMKEELLIDQLHKERTAPYKFISEPFMTRILALLYLFALVPGLFLILYSYYRN
ncbi:hypothetical protein MKW98_019016 [Papaver atlanticum]|uniref:PGG domain-containing protein n=1 Tax=Papaver atlanticum TaxID=357466 RepID=A0AAD4XXE2_9MAGN|nr:hypothetical protein MKW98_019016 [Papaver atlanticum]